MRSKLLVGIVASAVASAVIIFMLIQLSGRLGGIGAAWTDTHPAPRDLPELPRFPLRSMEPTVRAQFDEVLEQLGAEPTDGHANGALGMLYHAYGFFALAEPCYRRAAALDPDELRWWFYLGQARAGRGDWDGAAAAFDHVLEVRPRDVAALLYRADADRRRNRLDAARVGFGRVIELAPTTAQAHCGAGQVALRRGDLDAAVAHVQQAIRLAPDYGTAHYVLGQALRKTEAFDEAKVQLALAEQYLDDEPPIDDPLSAELEALRTGAVDSLHRGIELARRGRFQTAIDLFRESLRIDPQLAETHAQLGAALMARGDLRAARDPLRRAIELEPNLADAIYNLGLLEHRQGTFDRAVDFFREAATVRPDHFDAHLGLGTDLPHLDRQDEAATHLRIALNLRPDDPRPYKRLGEVLASAGDCSGAVDVLRAGMLRLSQDASIVDRLAWVLVTCAPPSPGVAAEALRLADAVCWWTRRSEPRALATKAAALAALERFDEAIATAVDAAGLADDRGMMDLAVEIRAQLQHYRAGEPYLRTRALDK
jgi:tetratricopeptide (TPR) repeat protein